MSYNVKVNDTKIEVLYDTDALFSVLQHRYFNKLEHKSKLIKCYKTV